MIPAASILPIVLLLALGGLIVASTAGLSIADFIGTLKGRGSRVGPATKLNALGVVEGDPEMQAAGAGLDLATYALARMISSEEGNSDYVQKVAVGWAAWNAHGRSLGAVLIGGKGDADEHFKAQGYRYTSGPGATAKAAAYASTAQDPREDDVRIAQAIVGGAIPDLTGGATNFFRPGLQDEQFAAGDVSRSGADVIAEWTAGGLARVDVPGIDPAELVFFKQQGGA